MANDATIEQLQIEVEASAKHAQSNIRALSTDLKKLSDRCHGGCGLSSILDEFKEFNQATDAIKAESLEKMANLADALGKLKGVGKVNLPSNISSQITEISTAASAFGANAISGLQGLSDGLTSLSQVGKISISSTLGKHLTEIANAGAAFNGAADTGFGNLVAGLDMLKGVKDATISSTLADHLRDVTAAGILITPTATSGFTSLADSLRGFIGLESVKVPNIGNTITGIVTATKGIDGSTAQKLGDLAAGLKSLTDLPSIPSGLADRINGVVSSVEKIGTLDTTKIQPFVESLEGLGNLKISSSLNTQIEKLAATADKLKGADFSGLINLNAALAPLAGTIASISTQIPTVANGLSQLGRSAQQSGQQAGNSEGFWKRLFNTLRSANFWTNLYAKMKLVFGMAKRLATTVAGWIDKSNQYIENVNLFTASMGEYAQEAQEYAEKVGAVMGIDPGAWMRNQGVFNTIITGFGVVGDRAYKMSKNLTQLGYDISSFFNISVDDAMKKLSSGISGELEPLRRLGFDLSATRLQEEATALGINKKVSAMTQAEKAELRYHAILTQVTVAQGDMARTLDTPANQLRILKAQVEQCARAFGNVFIPILNAVLPYAIALANAIRTVAQAIAGLFGFKMPEVDYSGISTASSAVDDLDSSLGSASGSAKKLKETLAGFDELNIIAQESGGSGKGKTGTSGAGGGGFDFELPEYDFLGGLIGSKADEILQKWQPAIDWILTHLDVVKNAVLGVAAGLAMWNIGRAFNLGLGKTARLTVGIAIAVYGVLTAYKAFKDQWENGVTLENMQTMLEGVGSAVLGLGIAFGTTGWGVGLLIGGLVLIINPLKEFIETGKMTDEMLGQLSIGVLAIGAGLALLTGGWIPLVVAAVGVAVAWVVQKWDEIKATFELGWAMISGWWEKDVQPLIDEAVKWIDTNLIQPVTGFFEGLWKSIMGEGENKTPLGQWWDELWNQTILPTVKTIDENIVQPIAGFFTGLWGTITGDETNNLGTWWDGVWNGQILGTVKTIDENIIQPIAGFFSGLWGTIQGDEENNLGTWWNNLWNTQILGTVNWIKENITDKIAGFFTALWDTFKDNETVQGAITWFNGLWTSATGFAQEVANVATNITNKIGGFFSDLWSSIQNTTAAQNAVSWFNDLWTNGKGFIEKVPEIATNITEKIGGYFSSLWEGFKDSELVTGAISWWNGLWGADGSIAKAPTDLENNVITPIAEKVSSVWNNFKDSELVTGAVSWWNGLWGAEGSIAKGIADINTNILTPIGNFFSDVWGNFVDSEVVTTATAWWNNLWSEDGVLGKGVSAVDDAVLKPIGQFFTEFWGNFKETESGKAAIEWWNGLWGETGFFQTAIGSVNEKVVQPIAGFFTDIWSNFTESDVVTGAKTFWDGLWGENGTFAQIPGALESTMNTIGGFFTSLWSTIKGDEENGIGVWWTNLWNETFLPFVNTIKTNITDPIGEAFSGAAKVIQTAWAGVENFFIGIINGIIDGINWLIGKLNTFNFTIGPWNLVDTDVPGILQGIFGSHISFGIPAVTLGISGIPTIEKMALKEVPQFAEGGFPEMGQMFIARERGAELVGEIGGRTAVANNEQIDRGIAEGVRDANAESNELLREQNEYLRQLVRKKWSLEPSTSLARTVKRSEEMRLVTEGV